MPNQITTGVKITVDASDIQNKFTKSVDQLNASLSKNQKALGLVYNEQGLLTNALGQTVDGLSQSAIKLGQYVDVLGRVRTYQNGFVDGLTKTQIEMGMYADEIGNVYNKLGELVGQTEKARKAQEAEAQAAQRAAQEQADNAVKLQDGIAKTADAVSMVAGQVAIFQGLMQATGASSTKAGAAIAQTAQALSVAAGSFKATTELVKSLSETLKVAPSLFVSTTQAAQAAAPALAAVGTEAKAAGVAIAGIGGPITIAISAVAALAAGLASLNASKVETDLLSQSFEDLEAKARAAGTTIQSLGDALKVGAFATASTDIDRASLRFLDAKETLDRARADLDAYKKEVAAFNESRKYATGANLGAGPNIKDFGDAANFNAADAEYKNSIAEYNEMAARYVDAARANQQTELDKINEQKKAYNALLKVAEKLGDAENADLFRREIDRLDGQIVAAREKQAQEAQRQADETARAAQVEREKTLANAGVLEWIKRDETTRKAAASSLDNYASTLDQWRKMAAAGTITTEELSAAQSGLASTLRDQLAKEIGVEISATEKTATAYDKLQKALDAGVITQEQANAARARLAEKDRADLANRVGVSFEAPKDNGYSSKVDALKKALDAGTITQEQYNAATAQLKDAARAALNVDTSSAVADYSKRAKELGDAVKQGIIDQKTRAKAISGAQAQLAQAYGVDAADVAAYEKRRKAAEDQYAAGLIDAQERDRRLNAASAKLEKARDAAATRAAQEQTRQNVRSSLGVDNLMQSLKSPVQKYQETLDQIAAALKANAVSFNEAEALRMQAAETYLKTLNADADQLGGDASKAQKNGELARSMSAGSEDLYLAQVRNATSSYQSNMTQAAQAIQATTASMLQTSQTSMQYLQMLVDNQGAGVAVWG